MCTETGISKGLLTDLKMGRRTGVSATTAQKIASYFNVSVGYLLGEEEREKTATTSDNGLSEENKKTAIQTDNGLSEAKQQLIALAEQCSEEQAELLLQTMKMFLNKQ